MAAFYVCAARSFKTSRLLARLRTLALPTMVLLALAAAGCYNNNTGDASIGDAVNFKLPAFPESGAHSVQVFTEMHYQPSYKSQEGPRLLPPADSVPITGKEVRYDSLEEYGVLEIPAESAQSYNDAEAQQLYDINCSVCHGQGLQGDGPITTLTRADGTLVWNVSPFPANLTDAETTVASTDGELFAFISLGGRQGSSSLLRGRESTSPMPEFMRLLSEDERWRLVQFLRTRIGR